MPFPVTGILKKGGFKFDPNPTWWFRNRSQQGGATSMPDWRNGITFMSTNSGYRWTNRTGSKYSYYLGAGTGVLMGNVTNATLANNHSWAIRCKRDNTYSGNLLDVFGGSVNAFQSCKTNNGYFWGVDLINGFVRFWSNGAVTTINTAAVGNGVWANVAVSKTGANLTVYQDGVKYTGTTTDRGHSNLVRRFFSSGVFAAQSNSGGYDVSEWLGNNSATWIDEELEYLTGKFLPS